MDAGFCEQDKPFVVVLDKLNATSRPLWCETSFVEIMKIKKNLHLPKRVQHQENKTQSGLSKAILSTEIAIAVEEMSDHPE